jgi:hypothetical protein
MADEETVQQPPGEGEESEASPVFDQAYIDNLNATWEGRQREVLGNVRQAVGNGYVVDDKGVVQQIAPEATYAPPQNPAVESGQTIDQYIAEVETYDPNTAAVLKTLAKTNGLLIEQVQGLRQTVQTYVLPTVESVGLSGMSAKYTDWPSLSQGVQDRVRSLGGNMMETLRNPALMDLLVDAERGKRGATAPAPVPGESYEDRMSGVVTAEAGATGEPGTDGNYGFSPAEVQQLKINGMTPKAANELLKTGKATIPYVEGK